MAAVSPRLPFLRRDLGLIVFLLFFTVLLNDCCPTRDATADWIPTVVCKLPEIPSTFRFNVSRRFDGAILRLFSLTCACVDNHLYVHVRVCVASTFLWFEFSFLFILYRFHCFVLFSHELYNITVDHL